MRKFFVPGALMQNVFDWVERSYENSRGLSGKRSPWRFFWSDYALIQDLIKAAIHAEFKHVYADSQMPLERFRSAQSNPFFRRPSKDEQQEVLALLEHLEEIVNNTKSSDKLPLEFYNAKHKAKMVRFWKDKNFFRYVFAPSPTLSLDTLIKALAVICFKNGQVKAAIRGLQNNANRESFFRRPADYGYRSSNDGGLRPWR